MAPSGHAASLAADHGPTAIRCVSISGCFTTECVHVWACSHQIAPSLLIHDRRREKVRAAARAIRNRLLYRITAVFEPGRVRE